MFKFKFQIFIENFVLTILSIIKIFIFSKLFIKIKDKKEHTNKDCIMLGNGPSLNSFLKEKKYFLQNKELFCVNLFPISEFFEELKPRYYVLAAPEVYKGIDKYQKIQDDIFNNLLKKTHWELFFFVPYFISNYLDKKRFSANKNIKIIFYNFTPIEGFEFFNYFCFEQNLGMPRNHNVLATSLMLSLSLNFKKIYLVGADHSWLKDIFVTDNNLVLLTQKHFYDEKTAKAEPMTKMGKGERKLYEILEKFTFTFKSYFNIKKYSKKRNSIILNITPNSYIDAFERINKDDI